MAITDKNTIKSWFKTKLKPTQAQFWAWMDSFWHKDESIPTVSISGLDDLVSMMVTLEKVTAVKKELEALIAGKVDKVDGKRLSTEDFTTELKNKLDIIDMSEKLDAGDYDGSGEDLNNLLLTKVDAIENKGLSTEDFTAALKTKLEGIDMSTKLDTGSYNGTGADLYSAIQKKVDKNGRIIVPEGNVIDMSAGEIFIKTLYEDTVLTVTNPMIGKEILLIVDGNYNLTLPGLAIKSSLAYNGFAKNYITIKCISVATDVVVVYCIDREKEEEIKDRIDILFNSSSEYSMHVLTANYNDVYVDWVTSNVKTKTGGGTIRMKATSDADEVCHVCSDKGAIVCLTDGDSSEYICPKEINLDAVNLEILETRTFNTRVSKINGSSTIAKFASTPNLKILWLSLADTFTTIDLSDLTKLEKFGVGGSLSFLGDPEIILPISVPENVYYRFRGNRLSETHVNSMLEFADSNWNIPSGEKNMDIGGEAPTGDGLTAKDSLIAKGWTITTTEPDTETTTT